MKKIKSNSGFTLIEIVLVVIIIGMLAALIGPKIFKTAEKSKHGIARTQISLLENAVKMFKFDTGRYPTQREGFKALINEVPGLTKWDGPYLSKGIPDDPWGRAYIYIYPAKKPHDFEIWSYGADGSLGGEKENEDISNWKIK